LFSIGEAIENSACFICFMTPEYQRSEFCKQELQYAKQRNIPIIPLKLEENWEPSSWLGNKFCVHFATEWEHLFFGFFP
jgi:hypothetical protein